MMEMRRQFPGNPLRISDMRDFIRAGCHSVWSDASDDATISQLELAVSEAGSNIVLHGLEGQRERSIELILNIDDQQASVTFMYTGCTFTPNTVPKPDFSGNAESGYGLYLIQQSVNQLSFSRDDAGLCTIRLVKNRQ
jgi:anti-sigma regulatory factor (Ser/Thr protein kinase)